MRISFFLFFTLLSGAFLSAQQVSVTAILKGCNNPDRVGIYSFEGFSFEEAYPVSEQRGDTFIFKIPEQTHRLYHLGDASVSYLPIILGHENNVLVAGDCRHINRMKIQNSPINDAYKKVKKRIQYLDQQSNGYLRAYLQSVQTQNSKQQDQLLSGMEELDKQKQNFLDSLKTVTPHLAKVAALQLSPCPTSIDESRIIEDVLDHYGHQYYANAQLGDPEYNGIAYVYESFRLFTTFMLGFSTETKHVQPYLEAQFSKFSTPSRAHRYAIAGSLAALSKAKHPLYIPLTEKLLSDYPNLSGKERLQSLLKRAQAIMPGSIAPDIILPNPEGNTLKLSDLRGQVVLLDFWASWCGPCRRENPNVVKLYQRFKEKGFTVFSVSLDKNADAWKKAIAKDQLMWPSHVSDLRGWRSSAASLYDISSIPRTVLIGRDGRIIMHNLRGKALEAYVSQLFEN